jgi:hypothetical protein
MLFLSFLSIIASNTIFYYLRHRLFPQFELSSNLRHTLVIIHNTPDQRQQTAQMVGADSSFFMRLQYISGYLVTGRPLRWPRLRVHLYK